MNQTVTLSTKKVIFDTDCLSSFLWVSKEDIFLELFKGLIVIPDEVYEELSKVEYLKNKVDKLIVDKKVVIESIYFNTLEYAFFVEMTRKPVITNMIIGNGEAAAIALSRYRNGVLASNNLKDIKVYVEEFNLESITTPDILLIALNKRLINEKEGNYIWKEMLKKRRKLPTSSFTKYMQTLAKKV